MPPKRKADDTHDEVEQDIVDGPSGEHVASTSTAKRARVSEPVAEASSSNRTVDAKTMGWQDIVLVGEDEITHWLRDIGNINSNSYSRFMKAKGATGGASNGTYYAAYVYFEKVRILQRRKKTVKREKNETETGPNGFPLQDRSKVWVYTGH
ncbi:hypothetical protein NLI96_g2827 [Meripilus lineatus]|uniref:DUF7726 domain-containing protein n=1 Tax=Meripilus lineatus TaxID=2056292 RepID=A0AAD5V7M8_9APHY|nr:hypothetical protein NLI96_g2827 [Physisporinus lineatus]